MAQLCDKMQRISDIIKPSVRTKRQLLYNDKLPSLGLGKRHPTQPSHALPNATTIYQQLLCQFIHLFIHLTIY